MLKKSVALLIGIGIFLISMSGYAEDNALTKLGRGLANDLSFWIEVPKQIYLVSKEYDPFTGIVFGSLKGVGYALVRVSAGAFDTASFLIPPYDKPLVEPEFVFEDW